MNAAIFLKHLDHVIACARAVQPLIPEIEAAPAKVASLRIDLARTEVETKHLREVLAKEKASWQIEWKSLKDQSDHDHTDRQRVEADLHAKLSSAQEELRRLQSSIAAVRSKLEKIATAFGKVDRMLASSAGAAAMNEVMVQVLEATR